VFTSQPHQNPATSRARRMLVAPTREQLDRRRVASARMFCGAAGMLVLSIFLPWATVLSVYNVHLSGGASAYLFFLASIYAGEAYVVHTRRVTAMTTLASWLFGAWTVINVFAIFNSLGDGQGLITLGAGVYVASIGVLVAILATIQMHRSRSRPVPPVENRATPTSGISTD
jgi:hypothetical protein